MMDIGELYKRNIDAILGIAYVANQAE